MSIPNTTVEIAFTTAPNDPAPVWVDVSDYVEANSNISISRGRSDEFETVQPSKLTVTLDNRDGRFTPEYTAGAYYPNVKKGRRIRVRCVYNSVTYDRFSGYIDEWPVRWPDGTSFASTVTVTASSRLARMGRGVELRSIIEEEYLIDHPKVLYTLAEAVGSTAVGNGSDVAQPQALVTQRGTGGTLTFAANIGPGTDDYSAPAFTPSNASNGKHLKAVGIASLNDANWTYMLLEAFITPHAVDASLVTTVIALGLDTPTSGNGTITLGISAGSPTKLVAIYQDPILTPSPIETVITGATTLSMDTTYHVALELNLSVPNITAKLWLNGVVDATATIVNAGLLANISTGLHIGDGVVDITTVNTFRSGVFNGTIAQVAIFAGITKVPDARILSHANSGLNGFSGERSDQRIARLAGYAGVPTAELVTETGLSISVANQITNGQTALALMTEVTDTESGVLFDARNGNLTFHARSHRYGGATVATFSASTGEVGADLTPKLDDQGLINDMTASRANGVTARSTDSTSSTDYGIYRQSKTLVTTLDAEVTDAANWAVLIGATPSVRIPNAPIDVVNLSTAQAALTLGLEIGDRVALSGLPVQAPASSMEFFVEGYTETIGSASYDMTFNLSPANHASVWILDSATYSVLGTTTRLAYANLLLPLLVLAALLGAKAPAFTALPAIGVLLAVFAPQVTRYARRLLNLRMRDVPGQKLVLAAFDAPAFPPRIAPAEFLVRVARWARRAPGIPGLQTAQDVLAVGSGFTVTRVATPPVVAGNVIERHPIRNGADVQRVEQPIDVPVAPAVVDLRPTIGRMTGEPPPARLRSIDQGHDGLAGVRAASSHVPQFTKASDYSEDGTR